MPIHLRAGLFVFIIVCVHTLPQNPNHSNDLVLNNEQTLEEPNTFEEAGPVLDKTNPLFIEENPGALNKDESDAFDRTYVDLLTPENSDLNTGGLSNGFKLSGPDPPSNPKPDEYIEPVPLPRSPPPPYYCENGRLPACCLQIFFQCEWWHKFRKSCQSQRRWTCCLKIDATKPHWGVDCAMGYVPFEIYDSDGEEVPAGNTAAPPTEPVRVPKHAPNAKFLLLPVYEDPGDELDNTCPAPGSKELCEPRESSRKKTRNVYMPGEKQ